MSRRHVYDGFVQVNVVKTPDGEREVIVVTDSVACLVCNRTSDEVLLVVQNRAPMIRAENESGRIMEVAAGRFDKEIGVRDLVRQELLEELGVTGILDDDIHVLNFGQPVALSPGVMTERQYLVYVEVDQGQIDSDERLYGASAEGEQIERRFIPASQLLQLTYEDMKTWALVQWFLREKRRLL